MGRQTSKNRWVNGKRTLKWFHNPSEFAGGSEMGTAVPLGELVVEENNEVVDKLTVYSGGEMDGAVALFLRCAVVNEPKEFAEDDVLDIIHQALRRANDNRINDVEVDQRGWSVRNSNSDRQIVITTDNGNVKQRFVIEADSICETECSQ